MRDNLVEVVGQLVLLFIYGIGAVITGAVGLLIEYQSYLYFSAGEYSLAAWTAAMGGAVLLFAYLFVTDKLIPSVRSAP